MAEREEFENETILILQKNLHMTKEEFVNEMAKKHKEKIGFSKPTIYKKINALIAEGTVKQLAFRDLEKYGIEETDKRVSYLILKRSSEIKEYLDDIFKLMLKGDDVDREVVLKETESYKKQYSLDAKQLDVLIGLLDTENVKLLDLLLRIIFDWITKYNRTPISKEKLILSLKKALRKHPLPDKENPNLRTKIILLLGWFKDDIVVKQFEKDIRDIANIYDVQTDYYQKHTAEVLEKNRRVLFDLEREMFRKCEESKSNPGLSNEYKNKGSFIRQVKFNAMMNLNLAESEFSEDAIMLMEQNEKMRKESETKLIDTLKEVLNLNANPFT